MFCMELLSWDRHWYTPQNPVQYEKLLKFCLARDLHGLHRTSVTSYSAKVFSRVNKGLFHGTPVHYVYVTWGASKLDVLNMQAGVLS